ncbi:MAG: phasin family protein [Thermodesulfobacteriota bacterium]
MLETLKRSILASLGAAFITKDRVEESVQRLVERGELTREEARRVTEEMAATGERELAELREEIGSAVNNSLEGLHIATQDQVDALEARLNKCEARLAELESQAAAAEHTADAADPEQG